MTWACPPKRFEPPLPHRGRVIFLVAPFQLAILNPLGFALMEWGTADATAADADPRPLPPVASASSLVVDAGGATGTAGGGGGGGGAARRARPRLQRALRVFRKVCSLAPLPTLPHLRRCSAPFPRCASGAPLAARRLRHRGALRAPLPLSAQPADEAA